MEIKQGDIFILGEHKVACGDSCDQSLVDKLIGKKEIRAIITDPPYGVGYVENRPANPMPGKISNDTVIANDHIQSDEEYANFTRRWVEPVLRKLSEYNQIYVFNGDIMICALRRGMMEVKIHFSQIVVWVKGGGSSARKDYVPQSELIFYGWFGKHKFERRRGPGVLFYPSMHRNALHPTMKPVGLMRKLILNSTKAGETVYDPFLGSGSTLIACEHTGRKCIGIEMDKTHCNTIIARWEKLTNKKAKRWEN
jgi:DNA modification methylase